MKKILSLVFLLFATFSHAEECYKYNQNGYEIIKTVDTFTSTAIGFAGVEPEHIKAYRCLMKSDSALNTLKQLLIDSKLPGQLYSMAGIYTLDKTYFDDMSHNYENNITKIKTIRGCIVGGESTVKEIFKEIKSGNLSNSLKKGRSPANKKYKPTE